MIIIASRFNFTLDKTMSVSDKQLINLSELAELYKELSKQNEITTRSLGDAWQSEDYVEASGELSYGTSGIRCDLDGFENSFVEFVKDHAKKFFRYDPNDNNLYLSTTSIILESEFDPIDQDKPWNEFWEDKIFSNPYYNILELFGLLLINYDEDEDEPLKNIFSPSDLATLFAKIRDDDKILVETLATNWENKDYIDQDGQLPHYSINHDNRKQGDVREVLADFIKEMDDHLLTYDSESKTVSFGEREISNEYIPNNLEEPIESFWTDEKVSDDSVVEHFIGSFRD